MCCTTRVFVTPELASPLVVVAHDAGAANLIIGWLRELRDLEVRPCLAGPALELWTATFGKPEILPLKELLVGAAALLSGTSYASDLEHQARALAKERGVHSIGVIDHWVNYPDRFQRNGSRVLPDEIWVSDEEARNIASACFPDVVVRQQPNFYLEALVAQVHSVDCEPRLDSARRVLYVLEPIRHAWADCSDSAGEFQALDYFIRCGRHLGLDGSTEIWLRPHPSDPPGKYDAWVARHADWNIGMDSNVSLSQSIAWADTVVGCETYAMVVGLIAGRRVVSTLPPRAPRCRLPMKNIIHLREIVVRSNLGLTI
jgi:hypothetical protein